MANLYLFPTLLADVDCREVIPEKSIEKILDAECFIVEEIRTARRFLSRIGYKKDFDAVSFYILNEHTKDEELSAMLQPIEKENRDIFLMSEAGLPCVADPGAKIVAIAQKRNINIIPFVGPSSIYMSLMASGFNGQNFAFVGYLPIKDNERHKRLHQLEDRAYRENQTQVFIEAPYRNDKLFDFMKKNLRNETLLCIASDITSETQSIKTKSIAEWKRISDFRIGKRNTIFLIYHN